MKKICIVTGSRAEYGLLYWLIKDLNNSPEFEMQLVVTGMHLSPEFGSTYSEIEKDGFKIDKKVEMLLSSDSSNGVVKSMGLGMIGMADALGELKPDLMVVLGDRFEILSACSAALIYKIPIAHLHGGEVTTGAFDESIRHAITKMSHLHFTAAEEYQNRVIQLGEEPKRVFNVGAMGMDNIRRLKLLDKNELSDAIGFNFHKKNLLITFHPVTLDNEPAEIQVKALFKALDELDDTGLIFTMPNADTEGRKIMALIKEYCSLNSNKAKVFSSLGQLRYLSTLAVVDGVIGNSSSGILEAPSFKIGTINIGDRQKGRIMAESVIQCNANQISITKALDCLFSKKFQTCLKDLKNPFDRGGASEKIIKTLKETNFETLLQKSFYNLN